MPHVLCDNRTAWPNVWSILSSATGDNRQATDSSGNAYTYDSEGNRLTSTDSTGAVTEYEWDYRNRLTKVTFKDNSAEHIVTKTVDYAYDVMNRLVKETVTVGAAVTQTVFVYDGIESVLQFEKTGSGEVTATDLAHRYLWGSAVDQILASESPLPLGEGQGEGFDLTTPGTVRWSLTDHQGSVRDIVDNVGTVADHRIYDSFGKPTSTPATDFIFGYTGKMYDSATNLQNNLNRWYDPSVGRWLSEDPIGLLGGDANVNRYCRNNPLNLLDRYGMAAESNGGDLPVKHKLKNGDTIFVMPGDRVVELADGSGYQVLQSNGVVVTRTYNGNQPSFGSLYWYYLNHPEKMDPDLQQWKTVSNVMIEVGITGLSMLNPCTGLSSYTYIIKGANIVKAVESTQSLVKNVEQGNYIGAIEDTISLIFNLSQLGKSCFAAGTPLLTPEGPRPIEQIKVGDLVLSAPEHNPDGAIVPKRVEELFQRISRIIELRMGGQVIRTTHEHPFYVQGKGWKQACALAAGDLLKSHDGRWFTVESLTDTGEDVTVYNMRIEEYHTYFVGGTAWGFSVWAHNADYMPSGLTPAQQAIQRSQWALETAQKQKAALEASYKAAVEAGDLAKAAKIAESLAKAEHEIGLNETWIDLLLPGHWECRAYHTTTDEVTGISCPG